MAMPSERFTGLAAVLEAVRTERGITQPLLVDRVGLGRSVVAQRVAELEAAGLVASNGLGPSTGGDGPPRAPELGPGAPGLGAGVAPRPAGRVQWGGSGSDVRCAAELNI